MTFDEYQAEVMKLAKYPLNEWQGYLVPGIGGEVGELQSLFAKPVRDKTPISWPDVRKELGDILWFVAAIASHIGIGIETVAEMNIAKLKSRQERGVLSGSGDDR